MFLFYVEAIQILKSMNWINHQGKTNIPPSVENVNIFQEIQAIWKLCYLEEVVFISKKLIQDPLETVFGLIQNYELLNVFFIYNFFQIVKVFEFRICNHLNIFNTNSPTILV